MFTNTRGDMTQLALIQDENMQRSQVLLLIDMIMHINTCALEGRSG